MPDWDQRQDFAASLLPPGEWRRFDMPLVSRPAEERMPEDPGMRHVQNPTML